MTGPPRRIVLVGFMGSGKTTVGASLARILGWRFEDMDVRISAFATPATREALQAGAAAVWLKCDLETILARVPLDGSRPLASSRETIGRLLAEREPSYRLADLTVDASGRLPEAVAREIVDCLFAGQAADGRGGRPNR
jgi:shikimate kinase